MKRLLKVSGLILCILGAFGEAKAAPVISGTFFTIKSGPTTVSVSSFTWTLLAPSTDGTIGTFFKNQDGNTGTLRIICSSSSVAPSQSTTTWQWTATPSANAMLIPGTGKKVYFWGVTSASGVSENSVMTEVGGISATYP